MEEVILGLFFNDFVLSVDATFPRPLPENEGRENEEGIEELRNHHRITKVSAQ